MTLYRAYVVCYKYSTNIVGVPWQFDERIMMLTIRLKHQVMIDRFNAEFYLLCQETRTIRMQRAQRELTIMERRFVDYGVPDQLVFELGALMIRESNYSEIEAQFNYGFSWGDDLNFVTKRHELDDVLITILRSAGWNDAQLSVVQQGLQDWAMLEHDRRVAILSFNEMLNDLYANANMYRRNGHFEDMNRALYRILESICDKRAVLVSSVE